MLPYAVPKKRSGFTLIELLVVIAIISLLVSILLPSLQKAKELATNVQCMSRQRNIFLAVGLYINENDEEIPVALDIYGSTRNDTLWGAPTKYISEYFVENEYGMTWDAFKCPSCEDDLAGGKTNYCFNAWGANVDQLAQGRPSPKHINEVYDAEKAILLWDLGYYHLDSSRMNILMLGGVVEPLTPEERAEQVAEGKDFTWFVHKGWYKRWTY